MDNTAVAIRHQDLPMELSINELCAQVTKIQEVMNKVMHKDEHYGVIPGTNKPSLLKPGAEKLCLVFRLDPQFESFEQRDGDHLTIKSKCIMYHIPTGMRMGSGEGSCSTKESKYAFRNATLACPECGKDAIIKGKAEFGGGWLCFKKKGGCGSKFPDDQFAGVELGKVAADNLADQYNTVLKMANKRALVAAVLVTTAASDIFTQDMEDITPPDAQEAPTTQPRAQAKPAPNPLRVSDPQRKRLWAICKAKGISEQRLKDRLALYGFVSGYEITRDKYEEICQWAESGGVAPDPVAEAAPEYQREPGDDSDDIPTSWPENAENK